MNAPRPRGRPRSADGYEKRVAHYEDEQGLALLAELVRRRGGVSVTALLRQLTREEAKREGLIEGADVNSGAGKTSGE